jgi:hypothetical protein
MNGAAAAWGPFDVVKFTLTYRGRLLSAQARSRERKDNAHEMREAFRHQLFEAWKDYPPLKGKWEAGVVGPQLPRWNDPARIDWCHREVSRILFCPLVVRGPQLHLNCDLDIKVLARSDPKNIFTGGDLDNRLKALIDALRVPDASQLPDPLPSIELHKIPFYCLLEDDRLVTEASIRVQQLLSIPPPGAPREYAEITVRVQIETAATSPTKPMGF